MMKKTKKTMFTVLCAGALVSASAFALAQPSADVRGGKGSWGMKRGKRFEHRMDLFKTQLGLSEAQLAQIKTIRSDSRARTKGYRQQLQPLRQQMRALLQADVVNEAQVVALHQKMRSLRQVMGDERIKSRLAVMRVLSKDQRAKMFELRGKHRRHRRGGRGF